MNVSDRERVLKGMLPNGRINISLCKYEILPFLNRALHMTVCQWVHPSINPAILILYIQNFNDENE